VVSYGRYTLIELGATDAQSDLMDQVVDITFPTRPSEMTVLDALHVVLEGSGYSLCHDIDESHIFSRLTLPNVHRTLGPLRLREALTTLIGRGWLLIINENAREICVSAQS
jgi:type IV pili sensor histidine kinase/response regulator